MYHSTLSHKQHKDNNMTQMDAYHSNQKLAEADKNHLTIRDDINGLTARVKNLLRLIDVSDSRNSESGNTNRKFQPKQARRLEELIKVRSELMSKPSEYFATLDNPVVRLSYEFEALNERQQKAILSQFRWMFEELKEADIPALSGDVWHLPLQNTYDAMKPNEQAHFTPAQRMSINSHSELKGVSTQPVYVVTDGDVQSVGYEKPILEA